MPASGHDEMAEPFHHTRLWRYRLPDGDFLQHTHEEHEPIGIASNLGYTILQLQGWLVAVLLALEIGFDSVKRDVRHPRLFPVIGHRGSDSTGRTIFPHKRFKALGLKVLFGLHLYRDHHSIVLD